MSQDSRNNRVRLVAQVGQYYGSSMMVSPDGKLVLTVGWDNALLWDFASGMQLRKLKLVNCVQFFGAGFLDAVTIGLAWQAFPGEAATYTTWNAVTDERTHVPSGGLIDSDEVYLSTDTRFAIRKEKQYCVYAIPTPLDGKPLRVWDLSEMGKSNESPIVEGDVAILGGRAFRVSTGEMIPDLTSKFGGIAAGGERVFLGDAHSLSIYNLTSQQAEVEIPKSKLGAGGWTICERSQAGDLVMLASSGSILIWDVQNACVLGQWGLQKSQAFVPGTRWVVGQSDDLSYFRRDVGGGPQTEWLARMVTDSSAPVVSADGRFLANRSAKQSAIWDLKGASGPVLLSHESEPAGVALVGQGAHSALAVGFEHELRLYSALTGVAAGSIAAPEGVSLGWMGSNPQGSGLLSTEAASGAVVAWDLSSRSACVVGRFRGQHKKLKGPDGQDKALVAAISPTADKVVTVEARDDADLLLWDAKSGKPLDNVGTKAAGAFVPVFLNDGSLFYLESMEKVYQISGSSEVGYIFQGVVLGKDGQRVRSFPLKWKIGAVSADEKFFAAWGIGDTMNLAFLDLATGEALRQSAAIEDDITGITFSADGKWVVTTSIEGITRIWDFATAKELVGLIHFMDGSWAVVDPEGRYDASDPENIEGLHFVAGTKPIQLSQLKQRFYTPGLLARALHGDMLPDVGGMLETVMNGPEVQYGVVVDGKLTVGMANRGGGLGRVVVRVNGREFAVYDSPPGMSADGKHANFTMDLSAALTAPDGQNSYEVLCFDRGCVVASRGIGSIVKQMAEAPKPANLFAIVVGVSEFANSTMNLRFPAVDALKFSQAVEVAAKVELFASKRITTFVTGGTAPTKANIKAEFDWVAQHATAGDVFALFLAGHGVSASGGKDSYYFLTCDARSFDVGSMLPDVAMLDASTVSGEEMMQWCLRIQALKQVIIMDTCAAGSAFSNLVQVSAQRGVAPDVRRAIEALKDGTGSYDIFGSAGNAFSLESPRFGHGLLTYALLVGMAEVSAQNRSDVSVDAWLQFAQQKVGEFAPLVGGMQKPVVSAPKGQTFPIGLLTDEDRRAIQPPGEKPQLLRVECLLGGLVPDEAVTGAMRDALNSLPADTTFVYLDGVFSGLPDSYVPRVSYQVADGEATGTVAVVKDGSAVFSEGVTAALADLAAVAVGKITAFMAGVKE